jgi:hypothetical protein
MRGFKLHRLVIGLALAGSFILLGASLPTTKQAHGEVRGTPEQPQFTTSSVPLLRDISGTLRQIDARLARMETTVQKLQIAAAIKARSKESN